LNYKFNDTAEFALSAHENAENEHTQS